MMTEGVTSTGFANHADYRKRFFHLSMNERQSLKFVKFSQAPQPYQNRVGGLMWHMPCSLYVRFHNFLRQDAPDD
jgi:hypothetical protein